MTLESLKEKILSILEGYPVTKVILFGSRAAGTNRENSDVDLILEFNVPISLMTLSQIKYDLEDILGVEVDVIHGPIQETDMIEVGKVVELYAA